MNNPAELFAIAAELEGIQNRIAAMNNAVMDALEANKGIAELTAKKREDSAWRKAKSKLKEQLHAVFTPGASKRVIDAVSTIGRETLKRRTVTRFTDDDIKNVEELMGELVAVCAKYKI